MILSAATLSLGGCALDRDGTRFESSLTVDDEPVDGAGELAPVPGAVAPANQTDPSIVRPSGGEGPVPGDTDDRAPTRSPAAGEPPRIPSTPSMPDAPATTGGTPDVGETPPLPPAPSTPERPPVVSVPTMPAVPDVEPPVASPPAPAMPAAPPPVPPAPTQPSVPPVAPGPVAFRLLSTEVADGGQLDPRFACEGAIPSLYWYGAPDGTVAFHLTLTDTATGAVWTARDIPAHVAALPSPGVNVSRLRTAGCLPGEHQYQFTIEALGLPVSASGTTGPGVVGVTRSNLSGGAPPNLTTAGNVVLATSTLSADLTVR